MKKTVLFVLLLAIVIPTLAQETKKVLFIGNSYTYTNNIPLMINNLTTANGDILIRDQNTPGGFPLVNHASNPTTLSKIASDDWDFVVIQAQSQEPSFPPFQVAQDTKPFAAILCDSVYSNNMCSQPLFYMTWGRENGDATNCQFYAPLCTYAGMQQRLRMSYLEMTEENNASCAPVGVAWSRTRDEFPSINLYANDGSHPSVMGSYLSACVFYSSIYQKSSVGNSFRSSLDSLTAYRLQVIASSTVLDSLDVWSLGTQDVLTEVRDSTLNSCSAIEINGISYSSDTLFFDTLSKTTCTADLIRYSIDIFESNLEILSFQSSPDTPTNDSDIYIEIAAQDYDSLFLYQQDTLVDIVSPGTFVYTCNDNSQDSLEFELVARNSCTEERSAATFACLRVDTVSTTTSIGILDKSFWQIFPNPAIDYIEIKGKDQKDYSSAIYDLSGREIIGKTKNEKIAINWLEKGVYFLVVYDAKGEILGHDKIVKK